MKGLILSLALVVVCMMEGRAEVEARMKVEAEDDIGEEVRAVVADMPVSDGFLLAERLSPDAPTDAPIAATNTTLSQHEKFEQLMNPCHREPMLMRATAWDLVLVVAVVAVSLAEARLLCVAFTGLQIQDGGKGDVKSVRLTLQSATPPNRTQHFDLNVPARSAVSSARRQYASC